MNIELKDISHGFSTVSLVRDESGATSVPVGVAAWDRERRWFSIRLLSSDESVSGVTKSRLKFAEVIRAQVHRWAKQSKVPYSPEAVHPWEPQFWESARQVLTTAVRFDPPRAMQPMEDPDSDLEALFNAVVKPTIRGTERRTRIHGDVSRALGPCTKYLQFGLALPAFGGTHQQVMRGVEGRNGAMAVEGVDLAGRDAQKDTDALVSKLMRIQSVFDSGRAHFLVGYRASPGGLNGEAHMKEWIEKSVTPFVFDVTRDQSKLQRVVREKLESIGVPVQLDHHEE